MMYGFGFTIFNTVCTKTVLIILEESRVARPSPHRRLSIGDYKRRDSQRYNLQSISACAERVWPRETIAGRYRHKRPA